ncbi:hypothetical protein C1646_527493 [Rhizophagus diaphanus]|nr:hypothetical protein C1646_527493 [Rhizophagus diaphanus] [Rhizophagus sp. MUCL 43196]
MSIDGTPITLWCLEYGSSSFSVTIGNDNSIFDLKKAIFEEISVPNNVKAKNLSLWSVNVEESQLESNTPNDLMTDENEIKIATQKVGNTFYGVQGNSIRVIVRAPVATEQPSGPPNKRIRIENENLKAFRDASAGGSNISADQDSADHDLSGFFDLPEGSNISANQDFLELPKGVHFLGEINEPSTLFIRSCYRHLLDIVLDNNSSVRNLIITGNPGIGKTYFGYYLLYNLIQRNQTVMYDSHSTGHVIVFDQEAFYLYEVLNADQIRAFLSNANNWYIVDGKEPQKATAKTILVCSPKKAIFKEFEKFQLSSTRYMPVWSYAEISKCKDKLYNHLQNNLVKTLFDKWGGIPRFVLEKATDYSHQCKLQEAIDACDFDILDYVGATEAKDTSHKLIHIVTNPLVVDVNIVNEQEQTDVDGGNDVEYIEEDPPYSQKIIKFASEYVAERVIMRLELRNRGKLRRDLFSSLSEGTSNSVLGRYFEEIAHQLLRGGGTFDIRSLESGGRPTTTKPFTKQDKIYTFSDVNGITDGCYYRPDNPNYPSIDSIVAPNELYQMTTAKSHPIKMIGLKNVYGKLARTGDISYYFVVPAQLYNAYKKQNFVPVPTRNRSAQNMPSWIRNRVKQYALRIDLASTPLNIVDTDPFDTALLEDTDQSTDTSLFGNVAGSSSTSGSERGRGRGRGRGKRGRPRKNY